MKLTILILALFFLSCEKEESIQTYKDEVCIEIQSTSPFRVTGNIGETPITSATCGYISPGDLVQLKIYTETPAHFTVKLYKNNKLIVHKSNGTPYDFYLITEEF